MQTPEDKTCGRVKETLIKYPTAQSFLKKLPRTLCAFSRQVWNATPRA